MSLKIIGKTVRVPSGAGSRIAPSLGLVLGVLVFSTGSAMAAAGPRVLSGSFGSEGAAAGEFMGPAGVAVNTSSGVVYVVDKGNGRVERFSATGTYEGQFNGSGTLPGEGAAAPTGQLASPEGIAVDSSTNVSEDPSAGDVYVADVGHNVIDKFSATGAYIGQLTGAKGVPFEELDGVGVDPKGTLWVYQSNSESRPIFVDDFTDARANASEEAHELVPNGAKPGFAVDGEDDLYVSNGVHQFEKLNSAGEAINKGFDREEASAAAVDFTDEDVLIDNIDSVGIFSSSGVLVERFGSGSLEGGAGLTVNPTVSAAFPEGVVYVADTASNTVQFYTPKQPGLPTVPSESESVSGVTATTATLQGTVDPDGAETSYYFRYGPAACESDSVACSDMPAAPGVAAGSGYGAIPVQPATLQGLSADTTYHYQLVAVNSYGAVYGGEHVFTTQTVGGAFALPDGRGFELVSPVEKNGGEVFGIDGFSDGGIVQAAANGDAVTYLMAASTATTVDGAERSPESSSIASQYLSTRGPDGWSTEPINTPTNAQSYEIGGAGAAYKAFSTELNAGLEPSFTINEPEDGTEVPVLSPEAPQEAGGQAFENVYVRDNATGAVQPLMTNTNSTRSKPAGDFRLGYVVATPDLKHILLQSQNALLANATEGPEALGLKNLYEWSEGRLELVNVLPGETHSTPGAILGPPGIGFDAVTSPQAISENGSQVVFALPSTHSLYVREGIGSGDAYTVQLDAARGGPQSGEGVFQTASVTGSRVFFTDTRRLTKTATATEDHTNLGDLYEFDTETGETRDLTEDHHGDPHGADVVGVLGASEDGSYVYFVANGVLAAGATPGDCSATTTFAEPDNACALYVEHEGVTRFIAMLSGEDNSFSADFSLPVGLAAEDWYPSLARTVRVSGNGKQLLFMSHRSLTGYDNRGSQCIPVNNGEASKDEYTAGACAEVYLYDAPAARLRCVSCNPDGATPAGPSGFPGGTKSESALALYDSRVLSASGARVFFDSADALVPQDTNHRIDVYEWEEDGEGSCRSAADEGGCVFLISGGKSSEDSAFVDASENGEDVFFTTGAQLVPKDKDQLVDLYDARVGGGVPAGVVGSACSGTGCQGLPAATPVFATPASVTFAGIGNFPAPLVRTAVKPKVLSRAQKLAKALKDCQKDKRKAKRAACERTAHDRYGAKAKSRVEKSARGGR